MSAPVPTSGQTWQQWATALGRWLNPRLPTLTTGSLTLDTGTSTTVRVSGLTKRQKVFVNPTTAAAATADAYVSSIDDGSFIVKHNAGIAGRTFSYLIV